MAGGGARVGAGGKKKALHDRIIEGNPGKRPLTVLSFDGDEKLIGEAMPEVKGYLTDEQCAANLKNYAETVYNEIWDWLHKRRCAHLIPIQLIENYAQNTARYIQCEQLVSKHGFTTTNSAGNMVAAPYIAVGQNYLKVANSIWQQIYQAVRENKAVDYKGENVSNDIMERLLNVQGG